MIIFWRLVLAHLLADFTLQLDVVNDLKRKTWWGMLLHTGTHLVLLVLFTFPYLGMDWVAAGPLRLKGWMALLCITVLHHLQDEWRIFAIRRFNTADGTLHFFWDQFFHVGVLFSFSPVLGFARSGTLFPEKWVVLGMLLVLVSHFATVAVYYLEKWLYDAPFPVFDEKYFIMAQRVVLWLFFLIPGRQWLPFLLLWLGYVVFLWRRRFIDFGRVGIYAGTAFTILCGLLARRLMFGGI